jgi:hypothetical protein
MGEGKREMQNGECRMGGSGWGRTFNVQHSTFNFQGVVLRTRGRPYLTPALAQVAEGRVRGFLAPIRKTVLANILIQHSAL